MKMFVGLGNPGDQYRGTRHNAGQMLVDLQCLELMEKYSGEYGWRKKKDIFVAEFPELKLVKSANVFMNESGRLVHGSWFMVDKLDDLYICHDDLDIPLGEYKIQFAKGPKDHGGVNSIENELKTKDFWRVRIGIDGRGGEPYSAKATQGVEYVLQRFSGEEREVLEGVMGNIIKNLRLGH